LTSELDPSPSGQLGTAATACPRRRDERPEVIRPARAPSASATAKRSRDPPCMIIPVTVVLALKCADGVVLGADSRITDSERGLSYPAQKLHPFGETAAWGGSGARAVLLELEGEFDRGAAAVLGADNVGRELQERVVPLLRHHCDNFIEQGPGQQKSGATPATFVMVAGYARGEPFIVDIDPHGLIGRYEDAGFHAIGSGSAMAQQAGALLAHFRMTERDVDHGVLAAVRVLDALRITSPSVGGPIDVYRLTADGAQALSDEDLERVRARVRRWAELENEALDHLPRS
jgi:proteasome beta subunit